jgi:hypothetical protein
VLRQPEFVQIVLLNGTSAFAVNQMTKEVVLTDQVSGLPCDFHLQAAWISCNQTLVTGQGCTCIDVPCPTSILLYDSMSPDITCTDSGAALAPFNLPQEAEILLDMKYDDGQHRAARYPPPNGANITFAIVKGADICEVIYDGRSQPRIRAQTGDCAPGLCTVQVTYAAPCMTQTLVANLTVGVVDLQCLQLDFQCQDALAGAAEAPTNTSGCVAPPGPHLRQLSCNSKDYQQRTVWVTGLLTPGRNSPDGTKHSSDHV